MKIHELLGSVSRLNVAAEADRRYGQALCRDRWSKSMLLVHKLGGVHLEYSLIDDKRLVSADFH